MPSLLAAFTAATSLIYTDDNLVTEASAGLEKAWVVFAAPGVGLA